ncbi:copper chaperone PCu(A)C [Salinimonas lutimaris]|uniref:copper chaperone PCu(A)C n=1 Tax=Salinimonas lutimaris TaxID=914153 RepID=UPI0015867F3D|nr:copper chaperone PCu(A)C [Salinimonas lutimaris]
MTLFTRTLAGLWLACCSSLALAQITVEDAWLRAPVAMSTSAAGYMTLHNQTGQPITLTGISVSPQIAAKAGLHQTLDKDGLMSMRPLPLPLKLAGDETLAFTPGGKHIMLSGLKTTLTAGDTVTLTLYFTDSINQTVSFAVKAGNTMQGDHQHHD